MNVSARVIRAFREALGLDRAIAASSATQLIRLVTGPITMVLIIRFLSPIEQGYYYSFAGVVGIQVFLEAGFSVSIAQFAAKEFAGLHFTNKQFLTGNQRNLSRLRSIFHQANRYYTAMALVLTTVLAVGGYFFFASKPADGVFWEIPWIVISICAGLNFLLTPFWAVLEGCNRVADISIYRFGSTLVGFAATAIGLMVSQSIWVVIWGSIASVLVAYGYLGLKWFPFAQQLLRRGREHHQVDWFKEIWGFQWRIAGTWGARYMVEAGLPAIAFSFFGPLVAGQAGMSFQLSRMVATIASSWTTTKIPFWGSLAAKEHWAVLNASWKSSAIRHIILGLAGQIALLLSVLAFYTFLPGKADRLLPPEVFAGFSIGWTLYGIWLVSMHYTRALRREPFFLAHLAVAIGFLSTLYFTYHPFGVYALTYTFALVHLPAAIYALLILRTFRLQQKTVDIA